jgi:dolichol kinase
MNKYLLCLAAALAVLFAHPAFALVAGGCGTACINAGSLHPGTQDFSAGFLPYLWRQLSLVAAFYISGYIFGRRVQKKKMSASLSRKLVCILTFAVSYANSLSAPAYGTFFTLMLILFGGAVILLMLGSLSLPLRRRVPALETVFASINRPEDEPYTLAWLVTEAVATTAVIMFSIPAIGYFAAGLMADSRVLYGMLLIPVFASGIGDALAEIVGKKWGRHPYATRSVFGNRVYTRTLEGSAMVFLTTLIVGLCVALPFSFQMPIFFWKAFILLPITLTLAEAKAPHTWDNPLLYLTGYATIILCLM